MIRIGYLAFAQAHQHLHWLPSALRLAQEPGIEVHVLSASRASLDFIRGFDPQGLLTLRHFPTPALRRDGLFSPPRRRLALLLHHRAIGRFETIVTTEATCSLLKRIPFFRSRLIYMMHGAGDGEGGYNPKLVRFDTILVTGTKDRQRLIARGLGSEDNIAVTGYAKFELVRAPMPIFADHKPMALYNPHSNECLSSWFGHASAIVAAMRQKLTWNFVLAPHVKLDPRARIAGNAPNLLIDYGSVRSIDMSYTDAASVYIGDVSSQVYEFIRRPRPCIFLNLDRIDWRANGAYAHWHFGQVIEDVADLGPALDRAGALQPQYEALQRAALARSIDTSPIAASERQAQAILAFARSSG